MEKPKFPIRLWSGGHLKNVYTFSRRESAEMRLKELEKSGYDVSLVKINEDEVHGNHKV